MLQIAKRARHRVSRLVVMSLPVVVVSMSGLAHAQLGAWPHEEGTEPPAPSSFPTDDSFLSDDPQGDDTAEAAELAASFEPSLAPFGTWTEDQTYGRVWVPSASVVGNSFAPYVTNGAWTYSEFGWTWASNWNWGWAPFHYGRWAHLDGNGPWCWVPATTWSPAWVAWRSGGGYAGWAPLAPRNAQLDPAAWRTSWVFVRHGELGQANPSFQSAGLAAALYRRTTPVRDTRLVVVAGRQRLINPGPTISGVSAGWAWPGLVFVGVGMGAGVVIPRTGVSGSNGGSNTYRSGPTSLSPGFGAPPAPGVTSIAPFPVMPSYVGNRARR